MHIYIQSNIKKISYEQSIRTIIIKVFKRWVTKNGEYCRNRITLENVNAYDEESKKCIEDNINRLRFRYRWIQEQIQSFNKVSDTIKDNMWYINKHNLV